MLANGLATTVWHLRALGDELVEPGEHRAAAGEHDVVDLVVRGRGEEELQRAR